VWACLAAAGVGFAIGMRFRVTFLLAAAVLLTVATIAVAVADGWSISHTVGVLVLLLAIQQASYLVGLYASVRR
jgi:heme/copper-type cytochrome/quinol oxidase subunit 4